MIVNIIYIFFFKAEISFFSSVFPLFSLSTLCIGFLLCEKLPQTQELKIIPIYYFPVSVGPESGHGLSWMICTGSLRLKLRYLLRLQSHPRLRSTAKLIWFLAESCPVATKLMVTNFCKASRREFLLLWVPDVRERATPCFKEFAWLSQACSG